MSTIEIPIVMTSTGATPADPATLRANLTAIATALAPGLTTDLPATLIEDLASTAVGALSVTDSAFVDLINSMTPYGANEFILNQLGVMFGIPQGIGSNGSVYVVFSGNVGFTVNKGFRASDGTHTYTVQDGGIIGSSGSTDPLYCVAEQSGTFAIPANSVTTIATSLPQGITLTCTNPTAGVPATDAQTPADYRAQVLEAFTASAQGFPTFVKALLKKIPGVQARLVSVVQSGSQWEVICGGGDPYAVAYAIFQAVGDITMLTGSTLAVTGVTNANPGEVTTDKAHGLTTGETATLAGITGMTGVNGAHTITVTAPNKFTIGVDTTSSGSYVSGGVVTPNVRNVTVSINDYPDTYSITFINPLEQAVSISLTWNTIATNFVSAPAIAAAANPALVAYINSIPTGQPINIFQMEQVFKDAVAGIISPDLISRMVFAVSINGISASPLSGTGIIDGDPESYFQTMTSSVVIAQG